MLFKPIKKVYINRQGEMLCVVPGKDQLFHSCPELEKALDLAERHNRLMEELTSFYEKSDHVYFE